MSTKYSICMANYNMGQTLNASIRSIVTQLDDKFEIVVVDDGSSDDSVEMLYRLSKEFPMIRVIALARDMKRKLGETRNISVREAVGDYCLLHLDCDDVYQPFISSWVEVFHQIESVAGDDVLVAGKHINMARRDVLLEEGPYINVFRAEDRYMWARFASREKLWLLDHVDFVTRLPKAVIEQYRRTLVHTLDHMITDFRWGFPFWSQIGVELRNPRHRPLRLRLFRLLMLPIARVAAFFKLPIGHADGFVWHRDYAAYRLCHKATFAEIMSRFGAKPDWSRLPPEARPIFKSSSN